MICMLMCMYVCDFSRVRSVRFPPPKLWGTGNGPFLQETFTFILLTLGLRHHSHCTLSGTLRLPEAHYDVPGIRAFHIRRIGVFTAMNAMRAVAPMTISAITRGNPHSSCRRRRLFLWHSGRLWYSARFRSFVRIRLGRVV
jgi:hypothetical protein